MGFKNFHKDKPERSNFNAHLKPEQLDLEQTTAQLDGERKKKTKDRMPLFEAYLECQQKVLQNEQRKSNGQVAEYRAAY